MGVWRVWIVVIANVTREVKALLVVKLCVQSSLTTYQIKVVVQTNKKSTASATKVFWLRFDLTIFVISGGADDDSSVFKQITQQLDIVSTWAQYSAYAQSHVALEALIYSGQGKCLLDDEQQHGLEHHKNIVFLWHNNLHRLTQEQLWL